MCQGDYITDNENALAEEHGEQSGQHSVFFELLLLEEYQEALFAHEIAIAHSVKLKVNEERDPFDNESSPVVSVGPFVESFIFNYLCLV